MKRASCYRTRASNSNETTFFLLAIERNKHDKTWDAHNRNKDPGVLPYLKGRQFVCAETLNGQLLQE